MYTPGQVAQMLDIPPSTLSRYARVYKSYLSEGAKLRRRAYAESDIVTLARIRKYSDEGMSDEEVKARLQIIEEAPTDKSALALVPSLAKELEHAQSTARNALALVESLVASVERLPHLESQIAALAASLEEEKAARLQLEKDLQAYKDRPWYKRIFNRS